MAQKLILPINKARITAGYKNGNYRSQFGYTHYGVDMTVQRGYVDRTVYASGNGKVTHCGWHPSGGNVIVIVYEDCVLADGKRTGLAVRYFHLESIKVSVGQVVNKDTVIGLYGNTGASSGAHLHVEVDTDTKYPNYSPQTSRSNSVLKAGTDSTINPTKAFYCKRSKPDYQSVVSSGYNTLTSSDTAYVILT